MAAYVLLSFIDDAGRSRVARVPVDYYRDLLSRAKAFESSLYVKPSNTSPKVHLIARLHQLAGVKPSLDTTQVPDLSKLLRKAKRKCHPDTGGSNKLWLELEKVAKELGLKI